MCCPHFFSRKLFSAHVPSFPSPFSSVPLFTTLDTTHTHTHIHTHTNNEKECQMASFKDCYYFLFSTCAKVG